MCKKPYVSWLRKNKNRPPAEADSLSLTEKLTLDVEPFLETLNTSACIDELLLTGKERMALGADIDFDKVAFLGRTRNKGLSASTLNFHRFILRMYIRLHYITSLSLLHYPLGCNADIDYIIFFRLSQ